MSNDKFYIVFFKDSKQKNDFKDYEYWKKKAMEGDADAQFNLGNCYAYAHGTHLDYDKAGDWWAMATSQGHIDAKHNLILLNNTNQKFKKNKKV